MKLTRVALTAVLAVAAWLPLHAQGRPQLPPSKAQLDARHLIADFEGALENSVRYAAQMLGEHMDESRFPEQVLLTGQARARGFRLEGHGLFFDVEFPSIRRSIAWTMRTLETPDPALLAVMKELRKKTQNEADAQNLDSAIKALEDQIQAYNARAKTVSTGGAAASGNLPVPIEDPRVYYSSALSDALISAMLDRGGGIGIGPDEWLTVAARESLDFRFMPDDPATTVIMRVKGSDLAALRDRRLTREEARKRVDVKQY